MLRGPVAAALKIVLDVLRFRLRRLEMANMGAAAALMVVFRMSPDEWVGRLAFAFGLNVLVYLNNDFHDVSDDLEAQGRDRDKTAFLREHLSAAIGAQLVILAALAAAAALWRTELAIPLVAGGGVCWAYSAWLKRVPGLDVLAMTIWGAAMPMVGAPVGSVAAWLLAAQLGLFSSAFESIQVLRDRIEDERVGTRTLAVALGDPGTRVVIRLALALAGAFAVACLSPWAAIPIAVAAVLPIGEAATHWNRVRLLLGVAFLVECVTVYATGATAGAWLAAGVAPGD